MRTDRKEDARSHWFHHAKFQSKYNIHKFAQKYKTSEKRLLVGPILVVAQFDLATSFSKKRSTITTGGLS